MLVFHYADAIVYMLAVILLIYLAFATNCYSTCVAMAERHHWANNRE